MIRRWLPPICSCLHPQLATAASAIPPFSPTPAALFPSSIRPVHSYPCDPLPLFSIYVPTQALLPIPYAFRSGHLDPVFLFSVSSVLRKLRREKERSPHFTSSLRISSLLWWLLRSAFSPKLTANLTPCLVVSERCATATYFPIADLHCACFSYQQ